MTGNACQFHKFMSPVAASQGDSCRHRGRIMPNEPYARATLWVFGGDGAVTCRVVIPSVSSRTGSRVCRPREPDQDRAPGGFSYHCSWVSGFTRGSNSSSRAAVTRSQSTPLTSSPRVAGISIALQSRLFALAYRQGSPFLRGRSARHTARLRQCCRLSGSTTPSSAIAHYECCTP